MDSLEIRAVVDRLMEIHWLEDQMTVDNEKISMMQDMQNMTQFTVTEIKILEV